MGLFRAARPLHERLALALDDGSTATTQLAQPAAAAGPFERDFSIHGVARSRDWDTVVTATAPAVTADHVRFVGLPGGELLLEDEGEPGDLGRLADAVETRLDPPYRAEAVRKRGSSFAVGARALELVRLPDAAGSAIALTVRDGVRELDVDGERIFGGLPALEQLGERLGPNYVVRAERLDGPLFEVRLDRL